jgi:xylan 1,4-beta-xylosidase
LSLAGGEALTSRFEVSLVAARLQALHAVAETRVSIALRHFSHSAGLVVFYDNENFAYLRLYRSESLRANAVGIVLVEGGTKRELLLDRVCVPGHEVIMRVQIDDGVLQFLCRRPEDADFHPIGPVIDGTYMSDEATRGFTGTMVGMACVDSYRRDVVAQFEYFDLQHGAVPVRATPGEFSQGARV